MNCVTLTNKSITVPSEFGNYKVVRQIGSGGTSVVVLARTDKGYENRAVKVIPKDFLISRGVLLSFEQELKVHKSLNHSNIVKLFDILSDDINIYVVMEYCGSGELLNWITDSFSLGPLKLRSCMYQILKATEYLHGLNIAHLDIKPENILFNSFFEVKLADFGCCMPCVPEHSGEMHGTIIYTAPEIFKRNFKDLKKADIWSIGIVFFAMVTGHIPWSSTDEEKLIMEIFNKKVTIPSDVPSEISSIINSCLTKNPNERPCVSELLDLSFFEPERNSNVPSTNARSLPVITAKRCFKKSKIVPKIITPGQKSKVSCHINASSQCSSVN